MGREFFLSSLLAGTPQVLQATQIFSPTSHAAILRACFSLNGRKRESLSAWKWEKSKRDRSEIFFLLFLDFYLGMLACLPAAFSFSKAAAAAVWVGGGARAREGKKRRGKKSHFHIRFPERTHKRKEEGK